MRNRTSGQPVSNPLRTAIRDSKTVKLAADPRTSACLSGSRFRFERRMKRENRPSAKCDPSVARQ